MVFFSVKKEMKELCSINNKEEIWIVLASRNEEKGRSNESRVTKPRTLGPTSNRLHR